MGLLDGFMGNASQIDQKSTVDEFRPLLAPEEEVQAAYQVVRDAFLFTSRRLIIVNEQGVRGKKVAYHSLPYKSVTHFSVETTGTFDLDAELRIWLSGMDEPIVQQFGKGVDAYEIQALLAALVAR